MPNGRHSQGSPLKASVSLEGLSKDVLDLVLGLPLEMVVAKRHLGHRA